MPGPSPPKKAKKPSAPTSALVHCMYIHKSFLKAPSKSTKPGVSYHLSLAQKAWSSTLQLSKPLIQGVHGLRLRRHRFPTPALGWYQASMTVYWYANMPYHAIYMECLGLTHPKMSRFSLQSSPTQPYRTASRPSVNHLSSDGSPAWHRGTCRSNKANPHQPYPNTTHETAIGLICRSGQTWGSRAYMAYIWQSHGASGIYRTSRSNQVEKTL